MKQLLTLEECQKLRVAIDRLVDDWEPDVYSWIFLDNEAKARAAAQRMVTATDQTRCSPEGEAIDPKTGIVYRKKIIPSCQSVVFYRLKTKNN